MPQKGYGFWEGSVDMTFFPDLLRCLCRRSTPHIFYDIRLAKGFKILNDPLETLLRTPKCGNTNRDGLPVVNVAE